MSSGHRTALNVETDLLAQNPALAEIVRRLVDAYQPLSIYLFGSGARGEGGPDSDYDLLGVVADDAPPQRRRGRRAYEVLPGTGPAARELGRSPALLEARRPPPAAPP